MMDQLNVVIRLHDPAKLRQLSAALFAVQAQHYQPVQAVIVLQNFSPAETGTVRQVVHSFRWTEPRREPVVVPVDVPPGDQRTRLLNAGLRRCDGRYLAFLDYDDVLYRHAYSYLVGRLNRTGAALAFARVYRKDVVHCATFDHHFARSCPFQGRGRLDLFRTNFCPLHSYALDRSRIAAEDLWFDETLTRLEDYELLLRLCAKYPTDFGGLDKFIGEYIVRNDGSNSVLSEYARDSDNLRQWDEAQHQLQRTRTRLTPQLTVQELLEVMQTSR